MSISINPLTSVDVLANEAVEAQANCTPVDLAPSSGVGVNARKKEYAVVNDGIFASTSTDEAPQWLMSLIGGVIGNSLDTSLSALHNSRQLILTALDQIQIANNNYNEIVNIDVSVEQAVVNRVAQLNARIDNANATITELDVARATAEEAFALSLNATQAQLGENVGTVANMQTALATLNETVSQNTLLVDAKFEDVDATVTQVATAISTAEQALASTQDLLESGFQRLDGDVATAVSTLTNEVIATENRVSSKFEYDSVLKIGGKYYTSGFGIKASAGAGQGETEAEPFRSEFWINAQKFKFTNDNNTGAVAPFTIDATGKNPKIAFNGTVSFSSVTGDDVPEAGATRNVFRGPWVVGGVYVKGDITTLAGDSWVAEAAHTATEANKPGTGNVWRLLAAKGNSVATVNIYRRSATPLVDDDKPTVVSTYNFDANVVTGLNNSWSSTIPEGTDPLYVSVASVAAEGTSSTAQIPSTRWTTPVKYVENGLNSATVFVYIRTATRTVPPKPKGSTVYNFNTQRLTTVPTNGWTESLPTTGGAYRWVSKATAASTGVTDDILDTEWSTPRLLAEDGKDGVKVTSTTIYRRSAAPLVDSDKPSITSTYNFDTNTVTGLNNSWSSTIPEGTDPLYASIASLIVEGTSSTAQIPSTRWTTPVKYVENGLNSATVFVYKRTATDETPLKPEGDTVYNFNTQRLTTVPTNGWTEGLPSSGGAYRWVSKATAASTSETDTITEAEWSTPRLLAEDGKNGEDGKDGLKVTTVNIYRRSATNLANSDLPSGAATYTFSTGNITGLDRGWTGTIPSGTDPLYVAVVSVSAATNNETVSIAHTSWTTPVKLVENGKSGLNVATVFLFRRTAAETAPIRPSNKTTYSFITQGLTVAPNNSWSEELPEVGGRFRWVIKATAASTGDTDDILAAEWSTPRLLASDGVDGTNGASYMAIYLNETEKPTKPTTNGIPSGWSLEVGANWTGNVWKSEGRIAAGGTTIVWSEPVLDFTSWRTPNKTTISGAYIETGTITTEKLKAKAVTAEKIDVDNLTVKRLQANTGANPVGMVIDTVNGFISVYDENGVERVRMGNL